MFVGIGRGEVYCTIADDIKKNYFTRVEILNYDNNQITVSVEWENGYLNMEAFSLLFQREGLYEGNMNVVGLTKYGSEKAKELKFDEEKLNRQLNVGFSGGEKKKNEILQMSLLAPKLSILDETDSGLDIDALRIVADGVNTLRDNKNSFLIITHYQRLLDYIKPDFVHVLMDGKIVKSGGAELALELEKKGYENFH